MDSNNDNENRNIPTAQQPEDAGTATVASTSPNYGEYHEESGNEGQDENAKKRKRPPITAYVLIISLIFLSPVYATPMS